MRISLCNEVLAHLPLAQQCETAARLGYDGLEIAPFTLSDSPEKVSSGEAANIRATVESFGLVVTGLHWLLVKPAGLSLTSPDAAVRARTLDVMHRLTGLCAELGGTVLHQGSCQSAATVCSDRAHGEPRLERLFCACDLHAARHSGRR